MAYLSWSDRYSVGSPIVDAEHHFASEEKYMKLAGYPEEELREHMRIHEELVDEIFHLYARLRGEEGGATSGVDVGKFIENWLSNHILDVDKRCEPYFRRLIASEKGDAA